MSSEDYRFLAEKDTWCTPESFIYGDPEATESVDQTGLADVVDLGLDPCAGVTTSYGAVNLRLEDGRDGLSEDWTAVCPDDARSVWVNPPFSQKKQWLSKIDEEFATGYFDVIFLLLPDSTDVKSWFHGVGAVGVTDLAEYVMFKRGRMAFYDPDKKAIRDDPTKGACISVIGEPSDECLQWLSQKGWLVSTLDL